MTTETSVDLSGLTAAAQKACDLIDTLRDQQRALLALAEKWEAAIQVAYNDYSYGQRYAFEQAAADVREVIEGGSDD